MNIQRINQAPNSDNQSVELRADSELLKEIFPVVSHVADEIQRIMLLSLLEFNSFPFVHINELILTTDNVPFSQKTYYGQRPMEDDLILTSSDFPNKGEISNGIHEIQRTNLFALKSDLPYPGDLIQDLFSLKTVYPNSLLLKSLRNHQESFFYKDELIIPGIYR
ncbi:hypothetical protein CL656_03935 [bacterium]|nr:hypothetical protein [bacterium]|tara:strand:- start:6489 stop:6983 length:495 start_codon:yes stop_codon:yes gene_type:complete